MNCHYGLSIIIVAALSSCTNATKSNKESQSPYDLNANLHQRAADSVTYHQHVEIDSAVNVVVKNQSIAAPLGKTGDGIACMVLARTEPGNAEIHEQMDDIAIIRSGHGTLKIGYEVTGKTRTTDEAPSRNWFCDSIKNAQERKLSPGDFIIIPAMTAHQYIPDRGDTLTYWTIKVKNSKVRK